MYVVAGGRNPEPPRINGTWTYRQTLKGYFLAKNHETTGATAPSSQNQRRPLYSAPSLNILAGPMAPQMTEAV